MGQLLDKVAIVTGAAGGLGSAIASLFAREGAAVLVADIRCENGERLVTQIAAEGGNALYVKCDVTSEDDWHAAVASAVEWRGRVDILVNNAGVNDRRGVLESDRQSWRDLMAVNLDGPFFGMRAVVPTMRSSGGGAIVNIASTSGLAGHTFAAYATSKWAIRGLTRSAALEFSRSNVRVNAVCPGVMVTGINRDQPYLDDLIRTVPLSRSATTNEVAQLCLYLASDGSAYVTGQDFVIDGGLTTGTTISGSVKK